METTMTANDKYKMAAKAVLYLHGVFCNLAFGRHPDSICFSGIHQGADWFDPLCGFGPDFVSGQMPVNRS